MSAPLAARPTRSPLRIVAWVLGFIVFLLLALVGIALLPSVQTAALRHVLTKSGATDIHLDAVRATPAGFAASRIAFAQGGLRIDAHGLAVRLRPRRLFEHEINLESVSVDNVDVAADLSGSAALAASTDAKRRAAASTQTSGGSAASTPFPLQLPWKVVLDKLDVRSKVTVHLALIQLETGEFHLTGGGLAPGATGTLNYEFLPAAPAFAAVPGGKVSGTLQLPESATGAITSAALKLNLDAIPLAWANLALNAQGIQVLDGQFSGQIAVNADAKGATLLPGTALQVSNLKLEKINSTVHAPRVQGASLAVQLLQPYPIDPAKPLAALEAAGAADWAKVQIGDVPLELAAAWLPGRQLAGTWTQGDAVIRYLPGQGVSLTAVTPWQFSDVGYAEGGEQLFHGTFAIKPTVMYGTASQWLRFTDLTAVDTRGYRVQAHGGVVLKGQDDRIGGGITLQASLPFLPGMPDKTGPYGVALSATAHVVLGGKSTLSRLSATITGKAGEMLASIAAAQPVTIEQTTTAEWLVSSPQPLTVKTAAAPLSGIESVFAARGFQVSGTIPATEFALWFSPRHFRLEPKTPVAVQHFHLERQGEVLIDRALLRFTPALDLQFEHHLLPTFSVTATTTASVKSGLIAVDGSRVGLFDCEIDLAGTEKQVQPKNLQGGLWLDLGALGKIGLLAQRRFPAKGEFRIEFGKSTTKQGAVEFQGGLARLVGKDGKPAPELELSGRANGDFTQRQGGFGVTAKIDPLPSKTVPKPKPTELHFGFKVDYQHLALLDISSHLTSDYINLDDVMALEAAFSPAALVPAPKNPFSATAQAAARTPSAVAASVPEAAPWGIVRGHFILAIKELAYAPYSIKNLGGKLEIAENTVALTGLSGELLGGKWSADIAAGIQPDRPATPVDLKAHFALTQIDAGQAVHLKYPNPPAGIDGKLNFDVTVTGAAKTWEDLPAASTGRFEMTANNGRMHLTLPNKDMISNALIIGGTFTFSKELRALGRFVLTLQDLPVNQIKATGSVAQDGKLQLETVSLDSPQLRLSAVGQVANAKTRDLLGEPLQVNASLSASGDIAVMLGGMNLLEKNSTGGFQKMKEPFVIGGQVGEPDLQPLYDLLARAVDNSHGTWGMLMRKVQAMVPKAPASNPAAAPKS